MNLKDHFIVATDLLSETEYAYHVGYILHHDNGDSLGAWVNQPIGDEVAIDVRSRFSLGEHSFIGKGGTMEEGKLTFLAPEEETLIVPPVYCGERSLISCSMNPENLKALSGKGSNVSVLFGFLAWQDGGLEEQVDNGLFKVVPASAGALCNEARANLWWKLINT